MVSIDRAGRIVIPKEIRDRLDIEPDDRFEVSIDGDGIRLSPPPAPSRRIVEVDGWPVIEAADGHVVTDADVQRWRDADRR
jgi:AbrB family looped-hinge helix DNA binding protein